MSDITLLNYKIEDFDEQNKIVKVTFEDGSWAQIRLSSPLPNNIEELENLIKHYAPTVEHLQAQSEEKDLSYINNAIGEQRTCQRRTQNQNTPVVSSVTDNMDSEELYRVQTSIAIQRVLAEMAGATV